VCMDRATHRIGVLPSPAGSARLRLLIIGLAVALSMTLVPASPAHAADHRKAAQIRDRVEYLVNRARVNHGLRRLRVSSRLQYYATDHARTMAVTRTIFHDTSGLRTESLRNATAWGENVGMTSSTNAARHMHGMFMKSAGHRANVLKPGWTHMGIGVAKRGGRTYIVQRFAAAR
jgi:uncharacterized protein YkwD